MKSVIAALLAVLILSVCSLENSIKQASLSEAEKAQILQQEKVEKQAADQLEKKRLERNQLLLNKPWSNVSDEEVIKWIFLKVHHSNFINIFIILGILLLFPVVYTRRLHRNYQ